MKILEASRRISAIIGICSLSDDLHHTNNVCAKIGQILSIILVLVLLISLDTFSVCHAVVHLEMGDLENSLFALIQVIAISSTIASYISLIYEMKGVRRCFQRLQNIFDRCKLTKNIIFLNYFRNYFRFWFSDEATPSEMIYSRTNKLCEMFVTWTIVFMVASYIATTIISTVAGAVFYYVKDGYVDATNLYPFMPLKLR